MSIASLEFLSALLAFTWVVPLLGGPARRALFAACGAGFLAAFLPNLESWLALGVFAGSGYAVAVRLRERPSRALFAAYLALLLAAFVVLQRYQILAWVAGGAAPDLGIRIIGLSYVLFRQIHFVIDSMERQILAPSLAGYLAYQANPFGLLAGPIQRYPDFAAWWADPRPPDLDAHERRRLYLRILIGVVKIAGIAALALEVHSRAAALLVPYGTTEMPAPTVWVAGLFAVVFYAFPVYVYFNFAGYCDVVIAGAALVGIPMPENFDRPWLARNMIDWWNRWHRSLGFWIRDYLFTPMYKSIAERAPAQAPRLAFLCYFVALFLAGVWHGSTTNWVIFGLLNGAGVAAAKALENAIVRRSGRKGLRAYLANPRIRIVSTVATVHFACFTMLFIPEDLRRSFAMLRALAKAIAG